MAQPGKQHYQGCDDEPRGQPGRVARLVDAALRLADSDQDDDAGERRAGANHGAATDVLAGEPCPERQRKHEAQSHQGLHHHEAPDVQRSRLQHPAAEHQNAPQKPDGLADYLRQEARIALWGRGLQRPPLLQHQSQGE